MTGFAGTAALARFHLRRDRVRIVVWIVSIVLLVLVTVASVKGLFPTQADLDKAAATSIDNKAALAFNGPAQSLDTLGGQIAFQVGAFGLTMVGLMSVLMLVRLTRAEEESGRLELVRSMPVARHAPLAAAILVVAAMDAVVGFLVAASLAPDLPLAGSMVFGASFVVVGFVFVGIAAVTAQVSENPRVASGVAGGVLGASYALRAIGDVGDGAASWSSPVGVAQKARPYAGERWWPLLILLALSVALVGVAAALASRRDFGRGLVAARPGPAQAAPGLGHPVGLAFRLQRASVFWWSVGGFLTGIAYGSIADSIDDFVADNDAVKDIVARAGGSLIDSFLASSLLVTALIAAGYALQSAMRARTEETASRAELVLVAGTSRARWLLANLVVALGGSVIVLAVSGLGTGLAYGLVADDLGQVPRLVAASLAYVPAVWLVGGIAVALFGVAPRAVIGAWAVLVACLVAGLFGTLLGLPTWLLDLSPFEQTPQVPAAGVAVLPLAVLSVVAVVLAWIGLAGFHRRDVG